MTPSSIALGILAEHTGLPVDEIDRENTLLGDLNLDLLDLVVDLETELGCGFIPVRDWGKLVTVADFIQLAEKWGKG